MKWSKIKWHVYTALFFISVFAVYIIFRNDKGAAIKSLNRWINTKRTEIIKDELGVKRNRVDVLDSEIWNIDAALEDIDKEREGCEGLTLEEKPIEELAAIFKELHR